VEVAHIDLTQYPWFYLARIRIYSYRNQPSSAIGTYRALFRKAQQAWYWPGSTPGLPILIEQCRQGMFQTESLSVSIRRFAKVPIEHFVQIGTGVGPEIWLAQSPRGHAGLCRKQKHSD
jgi:hypothetical protein